MSSSAARPAVPARARSPAGVRTGTARPNRLAYLAWLAICLIWGTTYLAIRICLETLPPGLITGLRWTLAGVLLGGVLALRGERLPGRSTWPGLALLGFLFVACGNGIVVWAEQWVPSGLTSVLLATSPFWMVGLEALLPQGESTGAWTWAALGLGFSGIVLLVWPQLTQGGAAGVHFAAGVVGLQAACVTWSIGSAYSRRLGEHGHTLGAAALEMTFGGLIMLAIGSAAGEWGRVAFSARSALAFGYLVLVGSITGFAAYIYALKHLPISTISLYAYINPVIAVILGTVFLGEPFGARTVIASAIILAGVALVKRRQR